MNEPIFRPRSATEILDASVKLYRDNLATLVTISLVLLLPFSIIAALLGPGGKALINLVQGLIYPIVIAMIVGVVDDVLHGRPADTSTALRRVDGKVGLLIGIAFAQGILTMLGFLFLIVPGLLVWVWYFAAPMTAVVEGTDSVGSAFNRSKALAKGQFGHVFGTMLLAWFAVTVVFLAFALMLGFVAGLVGLPKPAIDVIGSASFAAVFPVVAVVSTMLYFDLRVRNDAYDVESLVAELPSGGVAPGAGAPSSGTAARPGSRTL